MNEYQKRVVAEKADLDDKLARLIAFMKLDIYADVPDDERARLHRQWKCMTEYSEILAERIENFE